MRFLVGSNDPLREEPFAERVMEFETAEQIVQFIRDNWTSEDHEPPGAIIWLDPDEELPVLSLYETWNE